MSDAKQHKHEAHELEDDDNDNEDLDWLKESKESETMSDAEQQENEAHEHEDDDDDDDDDVNEDPDWEPETAHVFLAFSKSSKNETMEKMAQYQKEGILTDCTLTVGDRSLQCHRSVLSATSDYFEKLLESKDHKSTKNEIVFDNLTFAAVEKIVQYLYGREIEVLCQVGDEVKDCVEVAHKFQISELKEDLANHIAQFLTPENCLGWFQYAEKFELQDLIEMARDDIVESIDEVYSSDEFKELSKEDVINVLDKTGSSDSEISDSLLTAAIEWVDFNPVSRKDDVYDLFCALHLDQCSPFCLKVVTEKYEDLLTDPRVMKLVYKTVLPRLTKLEDLENTLEQQHKDYCEKQCDFDEKQNEQHEKQEQQKQQLQQEQQLLNQIQEIMSTLVQQPLHEYYKAKFVKIQKKIEDQNKQLGSLVKKVSEQM